MVLNIMIDTNIIIDALLRREPWRKEAEQIILLAAGKKVSAFIKASTITDIFFIVNRESGKPKAREAVAGLVKLLDVVSVDRRDCINAINYADMDDFEDALLSVCAAKAKARYIITRNVKDYVNSKVPPIEPSRFLEQFNSNNYHTTSEI